MSDSPKVVPFNKSKETDASVDFVSAMGHSVGQSIQDFEAQHGHLPTGGVWIFADDHGRFRVGWDTTKTDVTPGAFVGIALAALTQVAANP